MSLRSVASQAGRKDKRPGWWDANISKNEKEIGIMGQLDGVKIVDLSTYIAAPSCGRILASYGATLSK